MRRSTYRYSYCSSVRRNPPKSDSQSWLLPVGAVALGAGLVMLMRRGAAAATVAPTPAQLAAAPAAIPVTQVTSTVLQPRPTDARSAPPARPTNALIELLLRSAQARRVFYLQSVFYSTKQSDAIPDGVAGSVTRNMVDAVNQFAGFPTAPSDVTDVVLQRLAGFVASRVRPTDPRRLIPPWLTQAAIDAVNRQARLAYAQSEALQALPPPPSSGV